MCGFLSLAKNINGQDNQEASSNYGHYLKAQNHFILEIHEN
ncbi:MAG: hypothetical protein ACTSPQ_05490 [Candidatus Helarchaeota archaeon]